MKINRFQKFFIYFMIISLIGISVATNSISDESKSGSRSTTFYVGGSGPGNYSTIQSAIDAASSGDTVYVYNGIYYENVVIDKTIDFIGEDKNNTIIDGQAMNDVVKISADNVCFEHFTIDNSYTETRFYDYGIYLTSHNNSIRDCIFIDNQVGIEFFHASNNSFTENSIQSCNGWAMSMVDSNNNLIENNIFSMNEGGMCYSGSCSNTIINNDFLSDSGVGCLFVTGSDNNLVENNSISQHNIAGIEIVECEQIMILNNEIFDNEDYGIYCRESYDITFIDNHIFDNAEHGIWCKWTQHSTFFHNRILNNTQGLVLRKSNNNLFYENNIENNADVGISIYDNSLYNLFYHNNLIDNNQNAYDEHNNNWYNETISEGNYWSDYNGSDANNDGIGDTAYLIDGSTSQDNYPLMNEYVWFQIDIIQSLFDRGFPVRHAVDGDWAAAQNFTPTVSTITKVCLYARVFGTPEFDLTVELREDGPEGTLLDSVSFTPGEVPSSWSWFEIDFSDVTVQPGTDYFIVIPPAPSGVTTSFGYEWGYAFGNQYDDGSFWFTRDGGGLWRDLPSMYEFTFRTFGYS